MYPLVFIRINGNGYIISFVPCSSKTSTNLLCLFVLLQVACCNAINFSRLIDLVFVSEFPVYWLEPLIFMLQNSPKLKILTIDTKVSALIPSICTSKFDEFKILNITNVMVSGFSHIFVEPAEYYSPMLIVSSRDC